MSFKISIPVSHLFNDIENIKKLEGKYDCLETRPFTIDCELPNQKLFHADNIQPIHDLSDSDFKFLETIKERKKDLQAISFHCASCCDNPDVEDGIFHISDNTVYTRDKMYKNAENNIRIIRNIFGPTVEISIENNNYYPTTAYDHVTDPDFLRDIVYDNSIRFLFDNAHARVTAFNTGLKYKNYVEQLPLDRMNQIQFCEPYIPTSGIARDIHEYPSTETVSEILSLAKHHSVQYITPEYYKDIGKLLKLLDDLGKDDEV